MPCVVGATMEAIDTEAENRSEGQQLLVDMIEHLAQSAAPGTPIESITISAEHERLIRTVVGKEGALLIYGVESTLGDVEFPVFRMGGTA